MVSRLLKKINIAAGSAIIGHFLMVVGNADRFEKAGDGYGSQS